MLPGGVGGGGGGGGGGYTLLYPALFVVLFWLAFPSVSLIIVCFSGVGTYITACGRVISHTVINRWKKGSRSPRVSPHYCFTGEVPSRGGVRGDSPYKKLPTLQRWGELVWPSGKALGW